LTKKLLVFIPTLNESGTIREILNEIFLLDVDSDVLVIDDNSTDGTQEILSEFKKVRSEIEFLVRPSKLGIGSAHIQALNYAKKFGYEYLVTMDADGAHSPSFIPVIYSAAVSVDIVVGSRYLQKDSLKEWSFFRKILTHSIHLLTIFLLGIKHDSSSGFRCYKIASMPADLFENLSSVGYDFFFESMYVIKSQRLRVAEISIVLPARTYGHSKMTLRLALVAFQTLLKVTFSRISSSVRIPLKRRSL
jgi:dolichol-phosphate mannosyltransferase